MKVKTNETVILTLGMDCGNHRKTSPTSRIANNIINALLHHQWRIVRHLQQSYGLQLMPSDLPSLIGMERSIYFTQK